MTRYLFVPTMDYSEAAVAQLQQAGTVPVLEAISSGLNSDAELSEADAQALIQQSVQTANVKKGLVMRSLRAALTCDMHGPDLIQSWQLLHQHGLDRSRLQKALTLAKSQ
jgi:glutamyl-tRNA synthetase